MFLWQFMVVHSANFLIIFLKTALHRNSRNFMFFQPEDSLKIAGQWSKTLVEIEWIMNTIVDSNGKTFIVRRY